MSIHDNKRLTTPAPPETQRDIAQTAQQPTHAAELSDLLIDARNWDDGRIGTHWPGCRREHYRCMILALADALARLRESAA